MTETRHPGPDDGPAASDGPDEEPRTDVVVVGGGAAGLSAALVLGRARRSVHLIDAGAPRNAVAAHMHGTLWPVTRIGTGS